VGLERYVGKGASGYGVRLLVELARSSCGSCENARAMDFDLSAGTS
jgi:hypothetical protein